MGKRQLTISEIQKISLDILKKISKICEENSFRYTLAYGTLIGAIRHNGFIPWDDDLDIQMPRPDYEALLKFLHDNPIDNLMVFNHKWVHNYPLGISRIADTRYELIEDRVNQKGMGVFIDIYPIDGLDNTYESAKDAYRLTDKLRKYIGIACRKNKVYNKNHNLYAILKNYWGKTLIKLKGLDNIQNELERVCSSRKFSDYEYVGIPNWNWIDLRYKREWYEHFEKHQFEDSVFYITKYYDDVLREEYGDYMQLPPVEKRVQHHDYVAYTNF